MTDSSTEVDDPLNSHPIMLYTRPFIASRSLTVDGYDVRLDLVRNDGVNFDGRITCQGGLLTLFGVKTGPGYAHTQGLPA